MCERGKTYLIYLSGGKPVEVDDCLWELIQTLNDHGFPTVASCCGHGHRPGNIAFKDGRELIIAANFDEARKIDALFPIDINGHDRTASSHRQETKVMDWERRKVVHEAGGVT